MHKAAEYSKAIRTKLRAGMHHINHHPAGWPLVLFFVLLACGSAGLLFGINHHAKRLAITSDQNFIVILRADGLQRTLPTDAPTVGQLLGKVHIKLAPGDRVEPAPDAPITQDNFLVNVYRAEPVQVIDGANVTNGMSAAATPRGMTEQVGVMLYPEDTVTAAPTNNLVTEPALATRVVVDRATPVQVSLYSAPAVTMRTHVKTVGDWIKTAKIILTKQDTVKPAMTTSITAGMAIAVVQNGIHTVTVQQSIPAPVQTVLDTSLSFGSQAVRQDGSAGQETLTFQVDIENGNEVSRKLIQQVVTVQPVPQIVARGNTVNIPNDKVAVMAAAGVSSSDYPYVDYIFSRESHWNAAAANPSGYVGLGQTSRAALTNACPDWQTDPVCQTEYFSRYAASRYSSWAGAYSAWISKGWW